MKVGSQGCTICWRPGAVIAKLLNKGFVRVWYCQGLAAESVNCSEGILEAGFGIAKEHQVVGLFEVANRGTAKSNVVRVI